MEPRLGGRWLEISADGTETAVATITHWEPPHRLVMIWQINAQWKPDPAMKSEVDVRFAADGPDATLVELLHHKFETMGATAGASMRKDVDGGWPGLIERFVREAERAARRNDNFRRACTQRNPAVALLKPAGNNQRVRRSLCQEFIVHSIPGSPFGRAVLAMLEEKGASYRLSPVAPGTFHSPQHLARHPFGRVPVLEHDGFSLYETQAILRYLDRDAAGAGADARSIQSARRAWTRR